MSLGKEFKEFAMKGIKSEGERRTRIPGAWRYCILK